MPLEIPAQEHPWERDAEEAVRSVEERFGHPLPAPYRSWALATNGIRFPDGAGIPHTRLVGLNTLFQIKGMPGGGTVNYGRVTTKGLITGDYLPIGSDRSATVLLRLTEPDRGSVWLLPNAYRQLTVPAPPPPARGCDDDDDDGGGLRDIPVDLDFDFHAAGYGSLPEFLVAERLERVADDFDGFLSRLRTSNEAIAAGLADQRLAELDARRAGR